MHNVSYIPLKILTIGVPVTKILIKYISNDLEENEGKEKEPIDIDFTDKKTGPEMIKCYWL